LSFHYIYSFVGCEWEQLVWTGGTGSKPPCDNGWHFPSRFNVNQKPLTTPWVSNACIA